MSQKQSQKRNLDAGRIMDRADHQAGNQPGRSRRLALQGLGAAAAGLATSQGWAQSSGYPDRPIRILVPFPPGALTDNLGRAVAERLRTAFNQPVVVENRPGAGTMLAGSQVAKATPDGYTLMVATSTTLGIAPFLFPNPPIRITDLTGIAMLGNVQLILVARPDLPANQLRELISLLRSAPGRFNYASPGNGTVHHLLMEMIKAREKVSSVHIPYTGSVPALTDIIAGRMDFMFVDVAVGLPQVRAGKLKALAVTGAKRSGLLPDVAAVGEVLPGLEFQAWQSIAGPNGMPADVQARLHGEINKALNTPEVRAQFAQIGVEANPMSQADFNAMITRDAAAWQAVIKQSGAKVD